MQTYSDPSRASDPHALPDVEVFYLSEREAREFWQQAGDISDDADDLPGAGWYYCYCFPGCLPDSDPVGPFESAEAAQAAAQEDAAC